MMKYGCPECGKILPNPNGILDKVRDNLKAAGLLAVDIGFDMKCLICGHEFDKPKEVDNETEM